MATKEQLQEQKDALAKWESILGNLSGFDTDDIQVAETTNKYTRFTSYLQEWMNSFFENLSEEYSNLLEDTHNTMPKNWFKIALQSTSGSIQVNHLPRFQQSIHAPTDAFYAEVLPVYRAVKESFEKRSVFQWIFNHRQYTAERDSLKALTTLIKRMTSDREGTMLDRKYQEFVKQLPNSKTELPDVNEESLDDIRTEVNQKEEDVKENKIVKEEVFKEKQEEIVEEKQEEVVEGKEEEIVEEKQEEIVEDKQEEIVEGKQEEIVEGKEEDVVEDKKEEIVEDKEEESPAPEQPEPSSIELFNARKDTPELKNGILSKVNALYANNANVKNTKKTPEEFANKMGDSWAYNQIIRELQSVSNTYSSHKEYYKNASQKDVEAVLVESANDFFVQSFEHLASNIYPINKSDAIILASKLTTIYLNEASPISFFPEKYGHIGQGRCFIDNKDLVYKAFRKSAPSLGLDEDEIDNAFDKAYGNALKNYDKWKDPEKQVEASDPAKEDRTQISVIEASGNGLSQEVSQKQAPTTGAPKLTNSKQSAV